MYGIGIAARFIIYQIQTFFNDLKRLPAACFVRTLDLRRHYVGQETVLAMRAVESSQLIDEHFGIRLHPSRRYIEALG